MLKSLTIKNFAIIQNTSLNFDLGFNVLIGETGAGKSIIIDALNFVLGSKPNRDNIRNGETGLLVKAVFENYNKATRDILNSFSIEQEDILIINRTYSVDGKSTCQINGEPVTISMLKQLSETLVDSYGQNENVELLKVKNHVNMLDSFKSNEIEDIKTKISCLLENRKKIETEINNLGGSKENRERNIDLLTFQINEIENAKISQQEEDEIKNQFEVLTNAEKIAENVTNAIRLFENSNISGICEQISFASAHDKSLTEYYSRAKSALIEYEDIIDSLKDYSNNINYDEKQLSELDLRLENIKNIKKKYGPSYEQVFEFLEKSKNDLDTLTNCEQKLELYAKELKTINNNLYNLSTVLRQKRKEIATDIQLKIKKELCDLGMKYAQFEVSFNDIDDINEIAYTKNGYDTIEFLFSANKGEQVKSLVKTISGGEMSRFMLAIKNVLSNNNTVSTLIFDEIDAGISGQTGLMVAQKMANLSKNYQLICITHMQQVTAMADNYILIQKVIENNQTISISKNIIDDEVIEYIAGMSGMKDSKTAISSAKELKILSDDYKHSLNK